MYYGAIEAGGTKMVCAVGNADGSIVERMEIPTLTPEETMPVMLTFFQKYTIEALGVGTFGPVDLNCQSDQYGMILTSPKAGWQGFNFYRFFKDHIGCRVIVDTDVNVAALGEQRMGALQGIENGMYLTVGTGIGGGIIAEGKLVHGMLHPETGHILLQRHPEDHRESLCRFHDNCLEGLAAGPAIEKRTGMKGMELSKEHPVWDLESYYIAQALVSYTMVLATERIVLGGGVMKQTHLFPKIRQQFAKLMNGYMDTEQLKNLDTFIVPAGLGGEQGIVGALLLGMEFV
ncbi:MAG: ROK family protein [Clostridium sp.]|nr:ROK family protein [Clostridium sp.]